MTRGTVSAVVTTVRRGQKYAAANCALAARTAAELGIPNVPRGSDSLDEMRTAYGVDAVLVARRGLLTAVMCVLDCPLGTGADAIIESFAVGATGSVTALEANPIIAAVIGDGLAHATGDNYEMHAAMRRISVHAADALDYLCAQADGSYDAVYFDPMFRRPVHESEGMNALRVLADARALTAEVIAEARRVARRRVVMKERRESAEFARLGFDTLTGGKYSRIAYGVMEL